MRILLAQTHHLALLSRLLYLHDELLLLILQVLSLSLYLPNWLIKCPFVFPQKVCHADNPIEKFNKTLNRSVLCYEDFILGWSLLKASEIIVRNFKNPKVGFPLPQSDLCNPREKWEMSKRRIDIPAGVFFFPNRLKLILKELCASVAADFWDVSAIKAPGNPK